MLVVPDFFEECFTVFHVDFLFIWLLLFLLIFLLFFRFFIGVYFIIIFLYLFILLKLFIYLINSIFMRNTNNRRPQHFFFPPKIPINSSIVHLLHNFLKAFLMKLDYFFLILRQKQQPRSTFIQSMQNMQIFIMMFVFKEGLDCVVVVTSAGVDD